MVDTNEMLIQILQTLNNFQVQTAASFNELRAEIKKSREIENEKKWEENDKRWEQNEKRWEENEKRWEENERRWEETKKDGFNMKLIEKMTIKKLWMYL